jgi:hypothetical protein
MTGNLHEHHYTLFIITVSVLFRLRNFSDKICGENQNTYFMSHRVFENRVFYEIVRENIVQPGRQHMTI